MKRLLLLFMVKILAFAQSAHAASREVPLRVGESWNWLLETPNCDLVVSQEGIIDIKDSGTHLELRGVAPGTAKLQCGPHEVKVVVHSKPSVRSHLFRGTLSKMRGLSERPTPQGPQVHGRLLRFRDWKTLSETSGGRPWELRATIDPDVQQKAQAYFDSELKTIGVSQYKIKWSSPPQLVMSANDPALAARAVASLGSFGVRIESSTSDLSLQPLVRVQVHMVEISKRWQQEWGIQWPAEADIQILPKLDGPQSLMAKIKSLEAKGDAKVMASPKLIARSGAEANFLAGGEFAIKSKTNWSSQVQWKQHGVQLKIKPQSDGHGRLRMTIDTEISLIDASQSIDGVPGLKTNRLHSEFDLFSGQTLVLSGLIQLQEGESTEGLAGLSKIPVLGALFRSQNFLEQRSEMVVFVTPEEIKNDGTQKEI